VTLVKVIYTMPVEVEVDLTERKVVRVTPDLQAIEVDYANAAPTTADRAIEIAEREDWPAWEGGM
jgi:hypothetical protein